MKLLERKNVLKIGLLQKEKKPKSLAEAAKGTYGAWKDQARKISS